MPDNDNNNWKMVKTIHNNNNNGINNNDETENQTDCSCWMKKINCLHNNSNIEEASMPPFILNCANWFDYRKDTMVNIPCCLFSFFLSFRRIRLSHP